MLKSLFSIVFASSDRRVGCYIKFIFWLKQKKMRIIALILSRRLQRKYGVFLHYSTSFDSTLILPHPVGIVIGEGVVIGKNVVIFQNVTLGRANTYVNAYPSVGDNTIIYAGAVVLGDIKIGMNCIIGANAVVTKNIPDNSIAVGAPAKVISK